jgi:hypothetical protein
MPKFILTMSAKRNGELFTNSYQFESGTVQSEGEILRAYKDFYPAHTDISIVSFEEAAAEMMLAEAH